MLATGMRVVRGPDWVWENQGKSSTSLNSFLGDLLLLVIYTSIDISANGQGTGCHACKVNYFCSHPIQAALVVIEIDSGRGCNRAHKFT